MKTIIHVAEAFGGGIIEFILQIVKNQPGYRHIIIYGKRGVDIDAVRKQFPENAGFVEWPFAQREVHPIMDWKAFRSLRRIVKKIQREHSVQAIHLHSSKAGFLGRFALRGVVPGQRLIYTPHGLAFARQDVSKTMRLFYVLLEWVAAAYAGRVIACGASEAALMKKAGIRATYINNGTAFCPEEYPVTRKLKNKPEEKVVLTVGRVSIQKNPVMFNQIAQRFEQEPHLRFIWVGEGELSHELTASNIELTGWLSKAEVIALLKQADVYLSTALWEGLPFAVLEAMMCEKPLLLHRCVGNEDLVIENQNGFLFDKVDEAVAALHDLLKAPEEKIAHMGKESRRLCEQHFNARQMAELYRKAYEGNFE